LEIGMRGLLRLVAAALYAVSLLSLIQPFSGDEAWPAPPPANETVVAKTPLAVARALDPAGGDLIGPVTFLPAAKSKAERRDEWVQVAGYTTMVRSRPSAEAPPLSAYSVGRPLRVIAREAGFVRVQDLGSGQLGWVETAALAPFNGGYRQRENVVSEPQIAALAEPQAAATAVPRPSIAETPVIAAAKPLPVTLVAKKVLSPRNKVLAAKPKKEMVAAVETVGRGLFRKKRDPIQRVTLAGQSNTGLAAMVGRAIRGF
jgi:hypothetical protein